LLHNDVLAVDALRVLYSLRQRLIGGYLSNRRRGMAISGTFGALPRAMLGLLSPLKI
jgi:hypothetical protein